MDIQRFGIILNVENFNDCVDFYKNVFNLKVLFSEEDGDFKLTCLKFGDGYLMIETDGFSSLEGKSIEICPSKLLFNVSDVELVVGNLKKYGIESNLLINPWGKTVNFFDPDGNRVGVRDEEAFLKQIQG
ncbi:lactoylglutathione lyase [Sinobacterium caligoides]|uniref:Lactoylglutathione lyase n=1 Tax=Sinobacterium caligoides TaxID=933926 RepID=A0A3N2E094_9GAMM|nr:VOC family protein [Sinobacterium caligoides]ROS05516.1 lactoylglutathione lyase [Sinobacterium caligoides]